MCVCVCMGRVQGRGKPRTHHTTQVSTTGKGFGQVECAMPPDDIGQELHNKAQSTDTTKKACSDVLSHPIPPSGREGNAHKSKDK